MLCYFTAKDTYSGHGNMQAIKLFVKCKAEESDSNPGQVTTVN
jgi:hypothetical protein